MDFDEELLNEAIESFNSKNYEAALEIYNKFIESFPDYKEAYYNKGVALQKLNKHKESLESFSKSLDLDIDFIPSLFGKALSLSLLNEKEKALEIYDKILWLEEKNCEAYINKATILSELERYDAAKECINKIENLILNGDIENKEKIVNKIKFIKGNIEHQKGDVNKAIELYNKILEKGEFDEQVLTNKGICLLEQNQINEAKICFDLVLEKNKNVIQALEGKARGFDLFRRSYKIKSIK